MRDLNSTQDELDGWLDANVHGLDSLCPGRSAPTRFADLFGCIDGGTRATELIRSSMRRVVQAMAENYPGNLFWDFDRLVYEFVRRESAEQIEKAAAQIVRLMRGFGAYSAIRFRYAHDFLYGFDWAKWVAREPNTRADIGPFDEPFLDYLEARQQELLTLIEQDDPKYGPLAGDEVRNPFLFHREPEDERILHKSLAVDGTIPVQAWDPESEDRWGACFADARDARAIELGLAKG